METPEIEKMKIVREIFDADLGEIQKIEKSFEAGQKSKEEYINKLKENIISLSKINRNIKDGVFKRVPDEEYEKEIRQAQLKQDLEEIDKIVPDNWLNPLMIDFVNKGYGRISSKDIERLCLEIKNKLVEALKTSANREDKI